MTDTKALADWLDDPFWLSGEFPAKQKDMRHEAARILRDVVPLYEELRGAVISEPLSKRGHLRVNDAVQRLNAALDALEPLR